MGNFVVTGATSFIGVHLVENLVKNGDEVYAVIRPNSVNRYRLPFDSRIHVVEGDLANMGTLYSKLPEKIEVFYHLAWEGARLPYRGDRELQVKTIMPQ